MTRISRSSSLKSSRYQLQYADNLNNPSKVRQIEPINSSNALQNHADYPSEHALIFYENYYNSISQLKEEFKNFYHSEQAMRKAIESLDAEPEQFQHKMEQLLEKYNLSINSLHSLDDAIGTKYAQQVQNTISEHKQLFTEFGINMLSDGQLALHTTDFQKKISQSTSKAELNYTFAPLKNIILSAYRILHSIRIPKTKSANQYNQKTTDYRGFIFENKS